MSYLLAHWRGKLSLNVSLWVNMVGLLLIISLAELFVLPRLPSAPTQMVSNTLVSLLITRLIIYPWQLIGFIRAIEHDFKDHGNRLKTGCLQVFALLSLLFTLVYGLEVIQGAIFYTRQLEVSTHPGAKAAYKLELHEDVHQLFIAGDLDIGITSAVQVLLEANPQIKSVVLQSGGGHIYEGRGLAKLFTEAELDTYVYTECSSACATAFMGGKRRLLGAHAKLGFHQYKLDISQHQKMVPFYDTSAEQQRDIELFRSRGIGQPFLDRIFDQPASKIWYPGPAILLKEKVVHEIISDS